MTYHTLHIRVENGISLITLNRSEALNALNDQLTRELLHAIDAMEADVGIGAIVLTGSSKVFAAGADIKEIKDKSFSDVFSEQFITASWEHIASPPTAHRHAAHRPTTPYQTPRATSYQRAGRYGPNPRSGPPCRET